MNKVKTTVVALVAVVLLALCIRQVRSQDTIARQIPDDIKRKIMSRYTNIGTDGILWRAYHSDGDVTYVVTEWKHSPDAPYTSLDVFRIVTSGTEPDISTFSMHWLGGISRLNAAIL